MKSYEIPLSFHKIDAQGLHQNLQAYENKSHQEIVRDFEKKVALQSGAGFALALSTGTAALHLALKVLGVGRGDQVIVSTFTYIASVSPILYCGASPVLVDAEAQTWNMDPALLEEALKDLAGQGQKPKAIVVVHAYGMPARMDRIMEIAHRWEIPVVEDAAEAFGATINKKWVGTIGDIGIYSFNNNKSVTTFGGGVLVTDNQEWLQQAKFLSTHAREDRPYYEHEALGYNYAMGPLNAAYGLWECEQTQEIVNARRDTFLRYKEALGNRVEFQEEHADVRSSRWLTTVRVNRLKEDKLNQLIGNQQIEMRRLWNPMHKQPLLRGHKAYLNGTSEGLFAAGLCLPSGRLSAVDFGKVVAGLQSMWH